MASRIRRGAWRIRDCGSGGVPADRGGPAWLGSDPRPWILIALSQLRKVKIVDSSHLPFVITSLPARAQFFFVSMEESYTDTMLSATATMARRTCVSILGAGTQGRRLAFMVSLILGMNPLRPLTLGISTCEAGNCNSAELLTWAKSIVVEQGQQRPPD
jgi:hypothetical protein